MSNSHFNFSTASPSRLCRALAIGAYSVTSLFLRKKYWSLVHVGSSMIFVAGRLQVLWTNYERRIVVAHASQLLVELNAHRALSTSLHSRDQLSRTEAMQTCSSLSLSVTYFWTIVTDTLGFFAGETRQNKLHAFVQTFSPHAHEIDWSRGIITRKLSDDRMLSRALKSGRGPGIFSHSSDVRIERVIERVN